MKNEFVDRFAPMAADYADFRPHYPKALFDWLAGLTPGQTLAWDCATGTGQAAVGLAALFERVVATDACAAQIGQATPHPRIEYRVARAESSGLNAHSADIVTVAQALHWFERDRFFAEVRRVLKPGGLIHLKTDSPLLYEYTLEQIEAHKLPLLEKSNDVYADLVNRVSPAEQAVLNIRTYYERMWLTEGRKIHYVRFAIA